MVRMTNARRPRIRPRSSLTPTAPIPWPRCRSVVNAGRRDDPGGRDRIAIGVSGVIGTSVIVVPYAASTGSRSADVTWRKSSSRSLAARAKLTIDRPLATDAASRRADAASSPRNPSSIVPSGRIDRAGHVGIGGEPVPGRLLRLASSRSRTRRTAPKRSRCSMSRDAALGEDLARGRRSRRWCTAPRARAGCGC